MSAPSTSPLEWDYRFLKMAGEVAEWSKDPSRAVGAVLVSPDRRRLSVGYNGFPVGVADTAERLDDDSLRLALTIHAELNAILNAKCDTGGWTLYCTRSPCLDCAKSIVQAGIRRVVALPVGAGSKWAANCEVAANFMREAGLAVDAP